MPRKPSGDFDQQKYVMDYYRQNITRKVLNFNSQSELDSVLLKWLNSKENYSQYIKELILEDMRRATQ